VTDLEAGRDDTVPDTIAQPGFTACILAGGEGTRLGNLTSACPKPMLRFCEVPFLDLLLKKLLRDGASKVIVVAGYMPEVIERLVSEEHGAANVQVVRQEEPGTVASLRAAVAACAEDVGELVSVNGDTILDIDHADVVRTHRQTASALTIVTTDMSGVPNHRAIETDAHGSVTRFMEHVPLSERLDGPIPGHRLVSNCGCYCFDLDSLRPVLARASGETIERTVIPLLVPIRRCHGYSSGIATFLDFGTPERYAQANAIEDVIRSIYLQDTKS
jgi:NDP-sugar pyrophosphorylase family protein